MANDADAAAFYENLPKRRAGSGALFQDAEGRVLIVEPTYKPTWEIPGGSVETGEDPRSTCIRECQEELGISPDLGRLLIIEHQTQPPPQGDSIMFIYDGGSIPDLGAITLQRDELRSYRFAKPDELNSRLTPTLANRVRAAIRAKSQGVTLELVNGETACPTLRGTLS